MHFSPFNLNIAIYKVPDGCICLYKLLLLLLLLFIIIIYSGIRCRRIKYNTMYTHKGIASN